MTWLRLDDGYAQHPKIVELNDREFRLWIKALLYCARFKTCGLLSAEAQKELRITAGFRLKLIDLELLEHIEGMDQVHDFETYMPPDPTAPERMRRYRERNAKRNAARNGTVTSTVTDLASHARARARGSRPVLINPEAVSERAEVNGP